MGRPQKEAKRKGPVDSALCSPILQLAPAQSPGSGGSASAMRNFLTPHVAQTNCSGGRITRNSSHFWLRWSELSSLSLWPAASQRGSLVWRAGPWRPSGPPWPRRRSRTWSQSTPTSGSWGSSTLRSDGSKVVLSRHNTKQVFLWQFYCDCGNISSYHKSIRHIDENAFNVLFYLCLSKLLCKNNSNNFINSNHKWTRHGNPVGSKPFLMKRQHYLAKYTHLQSTTLHCPYHWTWCSELK